MTVTLRTLTASDTDALEQVRQYFRNYAGWLGVDPASAYPAVAVRGAGVLDPGNSNRDLAWQMAQRAATVVAQRNLLEIVKGLGKACRENVCSLVGGETAEMPGVYAPGDYDLAGTIVGVVDRARIRSRSAGSETMNPRMLTRISRVGRIATRTLYARPAAVTPPPAAAGGRAR